MERKNANILQNISKSCTCIPKKNFKFILCVKNVNTSFVKKSLNFYKINLYLV